jgi:hypothetical protein
LQESARKAAKVAEAEARRKAAQDAAERQQEEYRKRLEEKLFKTKPRLVSMQQPLLQATCSLALQLGKCSNQPIASEVLTVTRRTTQVVITLRQGHVRNRTQL